MFKTLLIANRGEIACRVIRTARKMGIETVAVYSSADRDALHVRLADRACYIGEAPAAESYLRADRIIEACEETSAGAVHPGYGFLSENASFARALDERGIAFVGPRPHAIEVMGDKIASKKLAASAGVNTIPGYAGVIEGADHAVEVARGIGYPVMIKASAGGGGKGMRAARNDAECREGFERATNEARSSFGDERVFIEKLIAEPRHIEIQVLADNFGNTIFLGERECSLQRRHQKVVEEAPSPFLDMETRAAMGEQAVALARAVHYRSAGTVEFIAGADRSFYFLEMNTRLQVEHPVTEFVTGLDLVEEMIRIANNEELRWSQESVCLDGWAIETRVYAEDPARKFLPSIGRLHRYLPPTLNSSVRLDTGVNEGGEVSMFYDPMIAKLVTHGTDRDQAIARMRDALDELCIRGVSHNVGFLAALMAHPRFVSGQLTTDLIGEEFPTGFHPTEYAHEDPGLLLAVAVAVHYRYEERASSISGQLPGHEHAPADDVVVEWEEVQRQVTVEPATGGVDVISGTQIHRVRTDWRIGEPRLRGTVNGSRVCVQVERRGIGYRLFHRGCCADIRVLSERAAELLAHMPAGSTSDSSDYLLSPMPGLLTRVLVAPGDQVEVEQMVAVVEAMKMENVLRAERDGTVAAVLAAAGDSLAVDQPILQYVASP